MQIGIDSFAAAISDPVTSETLTPSERLRRLLDEIELADKVGLDVFGIGEHHRPEFLDSAPPIILAAAAALLAGLAYAESRREPAEIQAERPFELLTPDAAALPHDLEDARPARPSQS